MFSQDQNLMSISYTPYDFVVYSAKAVCSCCTVSSRSWAETRMVEVSGGWRSSGDSWLADSPSGGGGMRFLLAGRVIDHTPAYLDAHAQLSQVTRPLHNRDGTTHRSSHTDIGRVSVSSLPLRIMP